MLRMNWIVPWRFGREKNVAGTQMLWERRVNDFHQSPIRQVLFKPIKNRPKIKIKNKNCRSSSSSVGKAFWIKVPQKRCKWADMSSFHSCGLGGRKNSSRAIYEANIDANVRFGN